MSVADELLGFILLQYMNLKVGRHEDNVEQQSIHQDQ